ncbi:MAG: carboxypeptidase regulatory-like domain-containing protein, partial [Candidatus Sumerlaeota bacterium]
MNPSHLILRLYLAIALTTALILFSACGSPEIEQEENETEETAAQTPEPTPTAQIERTPLADPLDNSGQVTMATNEFEDTDVPVWGCKVRRLRAGNYRYGLDLDGMLIADPLNPRPPQGPAERSTMSFAWDFPLPSSFRYPLVLATSETSPRSGGENGGVEFIYKGEVQRYLYLRSDFAGRQWSTLEFDPLNEAARKNLETIQSKKHLGTLTGRVLDTERRPVRGARIMVSTGTRWGSKNPSLRTVTSDENGYFEVDRLTPDSVSLTVRASGYAIENRGNLQVNTGQASEPIEIILERGGALIGTVRGRDGSPIGGARIEAQQDGRFNGFSSLEAVSDSAGNFSMVSLRKGSYSLIAQKTGYRTSAQTQILISPDNELVEIDLTLSKGIPLQGQAVYETREGELVPAAGAEIYAQLPVRSENGEAIRMRNQVAVAQSDEDGSFIMGGLEAATPITLAGKYGLLEASYEGSILMENDGSLKEPLVLKFGTPIRLEGSALLPDNQPAENCLVEVFSSENNRNPLLRVINGLGSGQRFNQPDMVVTSDAEGKFALEDLEQGATYVLKSFKEGYPEAYAEFRAEEGEPLELRFEEGRALSGTVVYEEGGGAVEGMTLVLMPEVEHRNIRHLQNQPQILTDDNGAFRFEMLGEGRYRIAGYKPGNEGAPGYFLFPEKIFSVPSEDGLENLEATQGARIRGVVVEEKTDAPIEQALVSLNPSTTAAREKQSAISNMQNLDLPITGQQNSTGPDGGFQIGDVYPLRYRVFARKDGFEQVERNGGRSAITPTAQALANSGDNPNEFDLKPGSIVDGVSIQMTQGGVISGTVVDPSGNALANMRVIARSQKTNRSQESMSGPEGEFEITRLVPEQSPYVLAVSSSFQFSSPFIGESEEISMSEEAPEVKDVTIRCIRGAVLRGRVVDENKEGVAGATLWLNQSGGGRGRSRRSFRHMSAGSSLSDVEGRFVFEGLFEGTYTIGARADGFSRAQQGDIEISLDESTEDLEIVLSATAGIRGHLEMPANLSNGQWNLNRRSTTGNDRRRISARIQGNRGEFLLNGVEPGLNYRLALTYFYRSADLRYVNINFELGEMQLLDENGEPLREEFVFVIPETHKLEGRLVDSQTFQPVVSAKLSLNQQGGFEQGNNQPGVAVASRVSASGDFLTDDQGRFEIERLYPGEFRLGVDGENIIPNQAQAITVTEEEVTELGDIEIQLGQKIKVRLIDAITGLAVQQNHSMGIRPQLMARSPGNERLRLNTNGPDSEGWVEGSGVPLDATAIGITTNFYEDEWIELESKGVAGQEVDLGTIRLQRKIIAVGRAIDESTGEPVDTNQRLSAEVKRGDRGTNHVSARMTGNGGFELTALPEDMESIFLRCGHYVPIEIMDLPEPDPEQVIQLGELRFEKGLSISGIVLDTEGEPVAGAQVTTQVEVGDHRQGRWSRSDNEGKFELAGLLEGKYTLSVRHRDYMNKEVDGIELGASSELLEIVLKKGRTLTGYLVDLDLQPVSGLRASVSSPENAWSQVSSRGNSDDEGKFTVENIGEGLCKLSLNQNFNDDGLRFWANYESEPFEFEADEEQMFLVQTGGELSLRIRIPGMSSEAKPRIKIDLRYQTSDTTAEPGECVARSANGSLERNVGQGEEIKIENIPPGKYNLTITSDETVEEKIETVVNVNGGTDLGTIFLEQAGEITGRLIDQNTGEPYRPTQQHVHFSLRRPDGENVSVDANQPDRNGVFKLKRIPIGETFMLSINHTDYLPFSTDYFQSASTTNLGDLALSNGLSIRARFADAQTGEPYDGNVGLRALGASHSSSQRADAEGMVEFKALPPQIRGAVFSFDNYLEKQVVPLPQMTEPGRIDLGTVAIERGLTLTVNVSDEAGDPIGGAHVSVRMDGGAFNRSGNTDGDGRAQMDALEAGQYTLSVYRDGYINWMQENITLNADQPEQTLNVVLEKGTT